MTSNLFNLRNGVLMFTDIRDDGDSHVRPATDADKAAYPAEYAALVGYPECGDRRKADRRQVLVATTPYPWSK